MATAGSGSLELDAGLIRVRSAETRLAGAALAVDVEVDLRQGRPRGSVRLDGRTDDATATQAGTFRILETLGVDAQREADGAIVTRVVDPERTRAPYELVLPAGHPTLVPFWRELRARTYDRPMARVSEPETTSFGAAVMAAHAIEGDAPADVGGTASRSNDRHLGDSEANVSDLMFPGWAKAPVSSMRRSRVAPDGLVPSLRHRRRARWKLPHSWDWTSIREAPR